jgi:hypothetical protein
MSEYATTREFGGFHASLGRTVIVRVSDLLNSAIVLSINEEADEPQFLLPGAGRSVRMRYQTCASEADLADLPNGCWTWPPRI